MTGNRAVYSPGTQIPGTVYKVLRLLAQGGMGFVYDVEDVSVGKRYVLKTLTPELLGRRDLAKRMEAEARVLAKLSHPNIVDVITAGTTQDDQRMPYFVMERLNGQSVRTLLDKAGTFDLLLSCRIAIDVLDALEHAHDNGVIHRDVKPDNIFLHRTPVGAAVTKLLDFGVMRLVDSNLDDTRGRFVGTVRYAAPEQVLAKEIGPSADLYAIGLVLYEMLAGRSPWEELDDMAALADAHINAAPPRLGHWLPVPADLEALVMSALSKDPDARPKDAFTFAAELRRMLKVARTAQTATRAPTAIVPLSTAGTPALASWQPAGTPSPSSVSTGGELIGALERDGADQQATGVQEFAKTLAGEGVSFNPEPAAQRPPAHFGATMRMDQVPELAIDRFSATRSIAAEALPLPRPGGDTRVEPQSVPAPPMGVFQASEPPAAEAIFFPPQRPSPTTHGAIITDSPPVPAPPAKRGAGVAVAAVVGTLLIGGVGFGAWAALEGGGEPAAMPAAALPEGNPEPAVVAPEPVPTAAASADLAPVSSEPASAAEPSPVVSVAVTAAPMPSAAETASNTSSKASRTAKPATKIVGSASSPAATPASAAGESKAVPSAAPKPAQKSTTSSSSSKPKLPGVDF